VVRSERGAWCWYKLLPLLEKQGHQAIAVDLPGFGRDRTPLCEISLQSYVDRVSTAIGAQPGRVILVGHDRGGIVISQMAEQRPARVEKLVYLAAFLLPAGQAMLPVFMSDTRSAIIQNLMIDDERGCMVVKEEACREAMYQDCSEEDTALAVSLLAPEPIVPLTTPLDLSERNFGRVPRVYIETRCDNAITLSMQRKMIADMPCEAVISIKTGHSPFFSAPQELADYLSAL
jgi:pimeloyl-ACP methyl ester carboxylesterase